VLGRAPSAVHRVRLRTARSPFFAVARVKFKNDRAKPNIGARQPIHKLSSDTFVLQQLALLAGRLCGSILFSGSSRGRLGLATLIVGVSASLVAAT
jgi:hypothetical protein